MSQLRARPIANQRTVALEDRTSENRIPRVLHRLPRIIFDADRIITNRLPPATGLNSEPHAAQLRSKMEQLPTHCKTNLTRMACLLVLLCLRIALAAQPASDCQGSSELEKIVAAHPSADGYNALGTEFGRKGQFSCAVDAFESSLHLEPRAWQGHYKLALALMSDGDAGRAYHEMLAASELNPGAWQIHLGLALTLSQLQQPEAAIGEFQKVLKVVPESVPALDGLARELIAEKKYSDAIASLQNARYDNALQMDLAIAYSRNNEPEKAIPIFSDLIKSNPENAQAHFDLGINFTQKKLYHEAEAEFREALRLDPTNDAARVSDVKALIILEQYPTALPVIQEYLHRKPHDFDALELAGEVDCGLSNYAEAEALLKQAVAINPNHYNARYFLGRALVTLGKPVEARVQLERALQLAPASSEARYQLAMVLRSLGHRQEAIEELKILQKNKEEVFSQEPTTTKPDTASQYLLEGDTQKAVELYRQSAAADPGNSSVYYDLALALDRQGNYSEERNALEKSIQIDAKFAPAHNQIGFLDLQSGLNAEAEREFKTALVLNPQFAEAQNNLGVLYGQAGQNSEAEKLLRSATAINPQYGQAFVNLGLILAGESRFSEAREALNQAVKLNPDSTRALMALAMVNQRLNRGSEAVESFRKVCRLNPNSAVAHLNLGVALVDQFKVSEALAEFTDAVRLDPRNAEAHYQKGKVLLDVGRYDDARTELEAATTVDPRSGDSWYLLGLLAKQIGATEQSIKCLENAISIHPNSAEAHFMLGQELFHGGNVPDAIAHWHKAVELRPQYDEALFKLSENQEKANQQEAGLYQTQFEQLQAQQHIGNRAETLDNFALDSAKAEDLPQAILQLKEGLVACGSCTALAQLHRDLGLIYCRSGDLTNGLGELMQAQKLAPDDNDLEKTIKMIQSQ